MDRQKAMEELVQGREFATQLQNLLHNPLGGDGLVSAKDLVLKIMRSFTDTISLLNFIESGEVSHNLAGTHLSSPCCHDRIYEDSGESRKIPPFKDRRGGFKRRKTSVTWTKVSPTPIDDGHAWRKYGQKEILNAKYPRNYYRCTHRDEQDCQATKQVQKTDEDPPVYRTTYMGHHTCKDPLIRAHHELIVDSNLLSFESNMAPSKQDHPFFSSFSSSIKQEHREEIVMSDDLTHYLSLDYLLSPPPPDLATLESSGPTTMLSSTPAGSDHGDVISGVYSCTTSSDSLDLGGFMVGSVDFGDVLHFD
ncbi:hypothetical protein HHK36_016010 [Tetracentron sinense]|uniref:WRKY domain-containing protein n=1 Tax=Tetracentron sinense TaxID=13715 RepID=A0A834Z2R1_TETSI|nr:hypothetical protein HHK36_016010 [Tetracentron sinense]